MIKFIARGLEKLGRKRVILDRQSDEPYMERYYLFLKDRKRFPFNIFLHKFLKSDPDQVHDHPWAYATLILKGGYWEWLPQFNSEGHQVNELQVWRGPGHFRVSSADSFHRIELDTSVECWTLFMPGPQRREWGFWFKDKWVQHEEYMAQKRQEKLVAR